jgi:Xaa-Pro aminopeptidase
MNDAQQKMIIAQEITKDLFDTVEKRGLIIPGKTELELAEDVSKFAAELFGITQYWHKKIVRAGVNTLCPFSANPPELTIQKDDIVIVDFGPVFEGWEADFARTYVIGNDPVKLKLQQDTETAWHEAKAWHAQQSNLTGAMFFNYLTDLAKKYGYEYAGEIGGHLVGHYPHEQPDDPKDLCFDIHPDNHSSILELDKEGNQRNWILEIHFADKANNVGGFFEQLLNS